MLWFTPYRLLMKTNNLQKIVSNKKNFCIILCTVPDKKIANLIATTLLEKKLAACISIIPGVTSFYFWKNVLEKTKEIQLIIKSFIGLKNQIFKEIKNLHSYGVPELLMLKTNDIDREYLSWVNCILN